MTPLFLLQIMTKYEKMTANLAVIFIFFATFEFILN